MASYRILYWGHIPIGVKATDINGTVRENLLGRFQEAFQNAALRSRRPDTYTTSNFHWGGEQAVEGSAADVAAAIVKALDATWNEAEALALFEQQNGRVTSNLDLRNLPG